MHRRMHQGFTLIELLVVIAIIAILASILFPVFSKAREKARQTQCTNNQRQIAIAISMYAQEHEEVLPNAATIWQQIKLTSAQNSNTALAQATTSVTKCPNQTSKANGYVFNNKLSSVGLGDRSIVDPTSVMLIADGQHAGTSVASANVAFSINDIDLMRHAGNFITSSLDGSVKNIKASDVSTWNTTAGAMALTLIAPVPSTFPASNADIGLGTVTYFTDNPAVMTAINGTVDPADTVSFSHTVTFSTPGVQYTVTKNGKDITGMVLNYAITGGVEPIAPGATTTFTLMNLATSTSVSATTWQWRKVGDATWTAAGSASPTAAISFPGVINVATVYEVQAISAVTITRQVNVDPLLFVLDVPLMAAGTVTAYDLSTAGGATTSAKVQTWWKWGWNSTTGVIVKKATASIVPTTQYISTTAYTTGQIVDSSFAWGDGDSPISANGEAATKYAYSCTGNNGDAESDALTFTMAAPTTTTRHAVIIIHNNTNGYRTITSKITVQGQSQTATVGVNSAQSVKTTFAFRASQTAQSAVCKIWTSLNSGIGVESMVVYDD